MTDQEVIVVGAGISGLSAAKWLRESGVRVFVLEARDRVGGKTYTKRDVPVDYVDVGGSYVGPTQDYVIRMAKDLGLETYLINEKEDLIFYNEGSRTRWRGGGFPTFWNPFVYLDVNHFFRLMDIMGKEIPNDNPWEAPHAEEWDKLSFQQFMDRTLYTRTARNLVHIFQSLLVASEPYESSLLWFLWYVKQCGGTERIFSTSNGGQERKIKGGSQQLSERMAELFKDTLLLSKPVIKVSQQGKTVTVNTQDGSKYTAQHVILALSPSLQYRIHFEPPMPPLRNQLMQRMPMGSVIKFTIYYQKPFWKDLGCCGSLLIEGSTEHPVIYALDDTKPDGKHPAITGFVTGDKCRQLVTKNKDERQKIIAKSLSGIFKSEDALKPNHYEDYVWMAEEYSGGCYTGTCPPGVLTRYGRTLRKPVGRIYFAGTETATQWSGYMDGAISSGERAAREVLYDMGKVGRDQIWQIEPRSKEIPGYEFKLGFMERNLPSVSGVISTVKISIVIGTFISVGLVVRKFIS